MKQMSLGFLLYMGLVSFLCRADFHYTLSAKIGMKPMVTVYCFAFSDSQKPKITPNFEENPSDIITLKLEKSTGPCVLENSISCLGYKEGPPNGSRIGNPPQFLFQEPIMTSMTSYLNFTEKMPQGEIEKKKEKMKVGCIKAGGRFRDNSN